MRFLGWNQFNVIKGDESADDDILQAAIDYANEHGMVIANDVNKCGVPSFPAPGTEQEGVKEAADELLKSKARPVLMWLDNWSHIEVIKAMYDRGVRTDDFLWITMYTASAYFRYLLSIDRWVEVEMMTSGFEFR
jgi:hypothetical protein